MIFLFKPSERFSLLVLLNAFAIGITLPATPYISFRSQGQNSALDMAGWAVQKPNDEESGDLFLFTEYAQTFRNNEITKTLFGWYPSQNCTTLSIKGSATDHTANDLLADWFYLPSNYKGTVSFDPQIQSVTSGLSISWLSDEIAPGLFLSVKAPIAWTRWNLKSVFFTEDEGTVSTPAGTYLNNAEDFFCSKSTDFDTTFTAAKLSCSRFGCHDCDNTGASSTRLTDIQTNLGYRFSFDNDAYDLSLFGRLVIPAGNAPCGEWLFEPIAGNGKHWELGLGVNGGVRTWQSDDESKQCGFYGDITLTHLFARHQKRVFDLKCKPLSRYMTAAHFVDGVVTEHAPLANLTSCDMKVSVGIQADIVALFNYTSCNWSFDLGYNLWAQSCEKFHCKGAKNCHHCNDSCDSSCENSCDACIIKNSDESWGISTIGSTSTRSLSTIVEKAAADATPIFITDADIDYKGAAAKGISNKIFVHVDYSWLDHTSIPHLGLGGEIEIGNALNSCSSKKPCCRNSAVSQWGAWLKGGLSF